MGVNGIGNRDGPKQPAGHHPDRRRDGSETASRSIPDTFERNARPASSTGMSGAAPRNVLTSSHADLLPELDAPQRRFTSSEVDALVRSLAEALGDDNANATRTVTYKGVFDTRRILETALAFLRDDFKPEKKAEGKTPTEKDVLNCLRKAFRRISGHSPDKWNNEIDHLIKPFNEFIENNAEGLRLVGTKAAKTRPRTSSARKAQTATSKQSPHWLAKSHALPAATPDGRGYVPYAGNALGELIEALGLPADRDAFEDFKREFREATGITLQAAMNWGRVRTTSSRKVDEVWKELIDQATEEGRLETFVLSHRPEDAGAGAWKERVEKAQEAGRLADLAREIEPGEISRWDWDLYTGYVIRHGHQEDVTVEPRKGPALDAVVPVYNFLSAYARERGMALDVWEYLAAIYPLIRELVRASDANGRMELQIPAGILGDLSFDRWGYSTLAQRVLQERLATSVLPSTLYGHSQKDTDTPAFWNIRRYVGPLAEGSNGDARALYLFWGGILRVVHALDRTAIISGFSGEALTTAPDLADTRFSLGLRDDSLLYPVDDSARSTNGGRDLATRIRKGDYDTLIQLSGDYVRNLGLLSAMDVVDPLTFTTFDEDISLDELAARQMELASMEPAYRAEIVGEEPPTLYSLDDAKRFYKELHETAEDLIFATRAHGSIDSSVGSLGFITANRPSPSTVETEGEAVFFVNDLFDAAIAESWNSDRVHNAIRARVFMGHAIMRGYLKAEDVTDAQTVADALAHFWTGTVRARNEAASDAARLERDNISIGLSDSTGDVRKIQQRERYETIMRGPVLPGRRLAPHWTEQWMRFARDSGVDVAAAHTALFVMSDYFNIARGFLIDFDRATLRAMIERRFADREYDLREGIYDALTAFFPQVGVADGIRHASIASPEEAELLSALADHAFISYLDYFPRERALDPKIPMDEDVLQYFVTLACTSHQKVNRRAVLALTRTKIETYNNSRRAPAISTTDGLERLRTAGLLEHRFNAFRRDWLAHPANATARVNYHRAWNAYFSLAERVRSGQTIDTPALEGALAAANQTAAAGPDDARLLHDFVENETRAIATLIELANDPAQGIVPFVRGNYDARFVTDASLRAFMRFYIGQRFTQVTSLDPDRQVRLITASSVGPHGAIVDKMPGFYRTLALRWMEQLESTLREDVEHARDAIEIAAQEQPPPMTVDEMLRRAAVVADLASFDLAREQERHFALIGELAHSTCPGETLDAFARRVFDAPEAKAAREAHRADVQRKNAQVKAWADRAASLAEQSVELYASWDLVRLAPSDDIETVSASIRSAISTMEASAIATFRHDLAQRGSASIHLSDEISKAEGLAHQAEQLNEALGKEAEHLNASDRIRAELQKASQQLSKLDAIIVAIDFVAEERLEVIKAQQRSEEMAQKQNVLIAASAEAKADIQEKIGALAAQAQTISSIKSRLDALSGESIATDDEKLSAFVKLGFIAETAEHLPEAIAHAAQELVKSLDGKGTKLSFSIEALYDAAAEAEGEAREELEQEITSLEALETRARSMLKNVLAFRESVEQLRGILAAGLDALEGQLPIAPATGFPEPLERETGLFAFGFLPNGKNAQHVDKVRAAIGPITNGAVLSTAFGTGSFMLDQGQAEQARAWLASSRAEPFRFDDIFGNHLELPAGELGVRLVAPSGLPDGHAFKHMLEALAHIVSSEFTTAKLLEILARPSNQTLFRDLLGELAGIEGNVTKEEALAAFTFWAMTHRTRLTTDLGERAVAKIFTTEEKGATRKASVKETTAPLIAPKSFAVEREKALKGKATLLAHPELGYVFALKPDGNQIKGWADVAKVKSWRESEPLELFFDRDNRRQTIHPTQIHALPPFITNDVEQHVFGRLHYQILSDPSLTDLAFAFRERALDHVRELSDSILYPIAFAPEGKPLPFSLYYLQEFAIELYQAAAKGDEEADAILALSEQNTKLAETAPETAKVSPMHIRLALGGERTGEPFMVAVAQLIRLFPDVAGAILIDAAITEAQDDDEGRQKDSFIEMSTMLQKISAQGRPSEAREILTNGYLKDRELMHNMLTQEIHPGMTLARYLTGRDEPWNEDKQWSDYPPAERLALKAPALMAITDDAVERSLETSRNVIEELGDVDHTGLPQMLAFVEAFPAFRGSVALAQVMIGHELKNPVSQKLLAFFTGGADFSDPATADAFVELITEPHMLRRVYEFMMQPSDQHLTFAEELTSLRKPWLPKIATTATQDFETAPMAEGTKEAPRGYTVQEHLARAASYAEYLSNPAAGTALIKFPDSRSYRFIVDTDAFRRALAEETWKGGRPTRIRSLDTLRGLWNEQELKGDLSKAEITTGGRSPLFEHYARTLYTIYHTPELQGLGRILSETEAGTDREHLLTNLIYEAAFNDEAPTLDAMLQIEALAESVLAALNALEPKGQNPTLLSRPRADVTARFPELAAVRTTAIIQHVQWQQALPGHKAVLTTAFPEHSAASLIFTAVAEHLSPGAHSEFMEFFRNTDLPVSEKQRARKRERFIELYAKHRPEILRILKQTELNGKPLSAQILAYNLYQGDRLSPIEELHTFAPELQSVLENHWTTMEEAAHKKTPPPFAAGYIDFGRTNPEFQKACAALLTMTGQEVGRNVRDRIIDLGRRLADPNVSNSAKQEDFTATVIDSSFHAALRNILCAAYISREDGQTSKPSWSVAEHLTDRKEPWLPALLSSTPAPASGQSAAKDPDEEAYTPEMRRATLTDLAERLMNPYAGVVTMQLHDGTIAKLVADEREARRTIEAMKHGNRKLSFEAHVEHRGFINITSADILKARRISFERMPPDDRFLHLLEYRISNDAALMPLEREIARAQRMTTVDRDPAYQRFLEELLLPIARTPYGQTPPYTLAQAQDMAVRAGELLRSEQGAVVKRIMLLRPPKEALRIFPEVNAFGSTWKMELMEALTQGEIKVLPDAPWTVLFYFLFQTMEEHLPKELFRKMNEIIAQGSVQKPKAAQRQFLKILETSRESIRAALQQEMLPGITFMRFFTGLDKLHKPESRNVSWDDYTPAERLHALAPEFAHVDEQRLQETLQELNRAFPESAAAHLERYPLLQKIFGILLVCNPKTSLEHDQKLAKLASHLSSLAGNDHPHVSETAVIDDLLKPDVLFAIRTSLQQPYRDSGKTIAERLTGVKDPWLPRMDKDGTEKKKGGFGNGSPSGAASPAPSTPAAPAAPATPSGTAATPAKASFTPRATFAGANRFGDLALLSQPIVRANHPSYGATLTELPASALSHSSFPEAGEAVVHSAQYAYTGANASLSIAAAATMTAMVPII